jgi:hypothetical protein
VGNVNTGITDPSKKRDPISKVTRAKGTAGMAQVREHLSSKHKAISSNTNTATQKVKIAVEQTNFVYFSWHYYAPFSVSLPWL